METTPDILAVLATLTAYIDRRVDERVAARLRDLQGPAPSEWLSTGEVAALKQRDAKTIRRWIKEGLPARKRGRTWVVQRADLEKFIAGERSEKASPAARILRSLGALHHG